jgi:hypothetical protein
MAVTFAITGDGLYGSGLSLLSSTGFHLLDGYKPKYGTITGDGSIPPYVREVIPVRIRSTGDDDLATELAVFHTYQRKAAEYWHSRSRAEAIKLEQSLANETGERSALIKSLDIQIDQNILSTAPAVADGVDARLIVERHPYWESATAIVMNAAAPSAAASVLYDYTNVADVVGDVGARIHRLDIVSEAGDDALDRVWIGIRSTDKMAVTPANFVPIWELEDGLNDTDVTDTVDATTASGGNKLVVSESGVNWDNEWHRVCRIQMQDILGGADEDDQVGRFLWLLRAKTAASTEWEVRLGFGYTGMHTSDHVVSETVTIDSTSWDYKECGVGTIPLRDLRIITNDHAALNTYEGEWQIEVWAQRTSGTGDLDLDCLCPIPLDDGFLYLEGMGLSAADASRCTIATSLRDDIDAVSINDTDTDIIDMPLEAPVNFRLPPGDGRLVIVYARATSSDITDIIKINTGNVGRYAPRWLTVQGAR